MKNLKSNLFVVFLVVFMLICGFMLGRYVFDKDVDDVNNITKEKQYDTEDGKVVTFEDNKIDSSNEFISLFVGKYSYEKEYEGSTDCKDYMDLQINADGTYRYSFGGNCSGGNTAKGNYAISSNKIYLFNDNCKISNINGECMYANCNAMEELNYKLVNGKVEIFVGEIELVKE